MLSDKLLFEIEDILDANLALRQTESLGRSRIRFRTDPDVIVPDAKDRKDFLDHLWIVRRVDVPTPVGAARRIDRPFAEGEAAADAVENAVDRPERRLEQEIGDVRIVVVAVVGDEADALVRFGEIGKRRIDPDSLQTMVGRAGSCGGDDFGHDC